MGTGRISVAPGRYVCPYACNCEYIPRISSKQSDSAAASKQRSLTRLASSEIFLFCRGSYADSKLSTHLKSAMLTKLALASRCYAGRLACRRPARFTAPSPTHMQYRGQYGGVCSASRASTPQGQQRRSNGPRYATVQRRRNNSRHLIHRAIVMV